jgi:hypothetical protein
MAVRNRRFLAVWFGRVERPASGRVAPFEPMVASDGWAGSRCQGRQPPKAVAAGQPLQRLSAQPSSHRGSMACDAELRRCGCPAVRLGSRASGRTAACVDQASCRMFLCARCRCQALVCRRCDRGQLYCAGTCAQKARHGRQRKARRRYQATVRGRAMHAERSRRYRARQQRVTDHGLTKPGNEGFSPRSDVNAVSSAPLLNRRSPTHPICHFCHRPASAFLRLSALRPRRQRGRMGEIYGNVRQFGRSP